MNNLSLAAIIGVQLVQVTLCIAGAALLSFGCLRRRPAFAAAVWLAVLCKCATPPIWASPIGVFSWLRAEKPHVPTPLPSWIEEKTFTPRPQAAAVEETPVVAEVASAPTIAWSSVWPWMVAGIWTAGFVWTFSRTFVLRRRWLTAVVENCETSPSLVRAVAERSKQLGMAPPRIVMVAADAGPAASGWFQPTVYLPLGADPKQLESMLVHELVHLRRRDPWLGALQAFVSAAYWFHPFVRWASNELSRCIEEACDAETVRELGCKPVEYATALVALLERRIAPPSVPVVAGMSPARSVRRRLEAVMKTNPNRRGSPARGPWLAFAAATLIALPGAGLSPSPPKPEVKPTPEILPNPVAPPSATKVVSRVPPPLPVDKNFCHRGYDLKPAVDVLMKHCGLREDAACNAVANRVIAAAEHIGPRPVFAIADQRLFAFAAESQHEMMRNMIEGTIQEWTVDQIVIETEIWEGPKPLFDLLPANGVEKSKEALFLGERKIEELFRRAYAGKSVNRLAAPKMTTLDRQSATIKIGSEFPLQDKLDERRNARTAPIGLSLELLPTVSADRNFVSLKVRYDERTLAKLAPPVGADGKPIPVAAIDDFPIVNTRSTETTVVTPWGNCVAIKANDSKMLVLKCTKAPRPEAKFNTDPPGDGRLQANADSRLRHACELLRRRAEVRQMETRVYPVDHLVRRGSSAEKQTADLQSALSNLFSNIETVELAVTKAEKTWPPYRSMQTVRMPAELHEALARMLRDVDPRTDDERGLGIPQEYIGIQ